VRFVWAYGGAGVSETRLSFETNATPSGEFAGYAVHRAEGDAFWRWEAFGPQGTEAGKDSERTDALAHGHLAFQRLSRVLSAR
jgi:hypothetical protein